MNNRFTKTIVIGLVVVLVMSLGAAAAFAQEDTIPDTDAQPSLPFGRDGFKGGFGHHGRGGGADEAALAEALGIGVEELQAAREQLMAERLAQALEAGILTQEQVDSMQAMQAVKEYIDREAIMAEVLGLTVDELAAAREDGSLRDILANIMPADLEEQMQAATESAVNEALADGAITQEQADLVLEQIENGLAACGKAGGHRSFGGPRGGFQGFGGAQPDVDGAAFGA